VGASIGITICPHDDVDVDGLMRNADLALYRAKSEERNTYRFYSADMTVQIEDRKALERDLIDALDRDELFMEYQPQFDLASNRLVGAEALVRWRHPTRGLLVPDVFIPVAEMTGLIVPLGRWVLDRVAQKMRDTRNTGLAPIFIATNISLSQCRNSDLVDAVQKIAARDACGYDWLELEVTEHLFLPPSGGVDTLRRLRNLGVTISIDDFGTGYSSFGRLINLPVDKIKIDRTFVSGLGESRNADMLVRAIIALAKSLGMTVTAEGIETEQQLAFLTAEGCTFGQGHYLGVPLSSEAFAALLQAEFGAPALDSGIQMR
jgi:EAL domain-containing protein (putative c-di-GMP-specific phosphodiesterase class I)